MKKQSQAIALKELPSLRRFYANLTHVTQCVHMYIFLIDLHSILTLCFRTRAAGPLATSSFPAALHLILLLNLLDRGILHFLTEQSHDLHDNPIERHKQERQETRDSVFFVMCVSEFKRIPK